MSKMTFALEEGIFNLFLNENELQLKIDKKDGRTINITGMVTAGSVCTIDGLEDMKFNEVQTNSVSSIPDNSSNESFFDTSDNSKESNKEEQQHSKGENKLLEQDPTKLSGYNLTRYIMLKCKDKIMNDLAHDMSITDVARKYNVNYGTISYFSRKNRDEIDRLKNILHTKTEIVNEVEEGTLFGRPLDELIDNPNDHHEEETQKEEVVDEEQPKTTEVTSLDPDVEAKIIDQLINDIPIIRLADDFKVSREVISNIYFENKDYIKSARETRIRMPKSSDQTKDSDVASAESLQSLVDQYANR